MSLCIPGSQYTGPHSPAEEATRRAAETPQRRVVCAALRNELGSLVIGPRHFDGVMRDTLDEFEGDYAQEWKTAEQGFIDQHGVFMTREAAFVVALAAGQIIRKCGNAGGTKLFSEHLY